MKSFAQKYLSNTRLIILVILALLITGILSYTQLPRELMSTINIPMMAIMATYPGANANDVEELVTNKIETSLKSVKGIKETTSTSSENMAVLIVTFDDYVNLDDAYNEVSRKINQIQDFPSDLADPQLFKVDFDSTPIWVFNLEGTDMIGLMNTAEELKAAIENNADIDRVDIGGGSNREIQVIIDQQKVNELGIKPQSIAQAVGQNLSNAPAGTVVLNDYQLTVSSDKTITDLDTLRQMPLQIDGQIYPLGELAAVYDNEKAGSTHSYELIPQPGNDQAQPIQTISMVVYKVAGRPIDAATQHAKTAAEEYMTDHPDYLIRTGMDMGEEINKTFNDLMLNIGATIILVFIVMFLFLGFREALIASACIPFVMLLAFALMNVMGISINMISLMGLLLALGMLVDNAIVVVTALHRQYKAANQNGQKQSALQSAVIVWREFFAALVATNLTTVWAFLPLLIMTGILGEMIRPLPIILSIAIIGSALVAFFISLPLGVFILDLKLPTRVQKFLMIGGALLAVVGILIFLPTNLPLRIAVAIALLLFIWLAVRYYVFRHTQRPAHSWWKKVKKVFSSGIIDITKLENFYQGFMSRLIVKPKARRKVLVAIIVVTVLCFVLPFTPTIITEMMPGDEEPTVYVETILPPGTQPEIVEQEMLVMLQELAGYGDVVDYVSADVGQSASQDMTTSSLDSQFLLTVHLHDKALSDGHKVDPSEVAQELRTKWQGYQVGEVRVSQDMGTSGSFGAAVDLSITGPEEEILEEQATKIIAYLEGTGQVTNIVKSTQETTSRITFIPDQQALQEFGLSQSDINSSLRTTLSGSNLGELRLTGQENAYDIYFRYHDDLVKMDDLSQVLISTSEGNIPLSSLGHFELKPNQEAINHYNYSPSINITADALPGESGTEIGTALNQFVSTELDMPAGYGTVTGGMNESFSESINSLMIAMAIAFMLILITLVLQLRSFRKTAIVMSVIPVSISGVFLVLALTGITLSIPSIIGILALFGIVVNNSILVVERINQNLDEGMEMTPAIVNGATSRLQPIVMTSLTTIIGLVPLVVSDPLWRGLGSTIIAGLTFSGTLMLLFLPIMYSMWFDPEKLRLKDERWAKWKQKMFGLSQS